MADEILVTVVDGDSGIITVEADTNITVEDTEETLENTVADETPAEITVEGDTTVNITEAAFDKDSFVRETFTGLNGTDNILTFGNTFRSNSLTLYLNGILMEKTVDYTEAVIRDAATVLVNLEVADKIEARYVIE
jgi:metallophosphoesterase superfamily enzyme